MRILIIDDEPAAGNILKVLVNKYIEGPFETIYFQDPAEALKVLESFNPTLILLDIEMPGMNGFDFLNSAPVTDFDVIFTTAFDQYAIKAIRFSALDYLLKPIDGPELQNAIHRHIMREVRKTSKHLQVENLLSNLQLTDSSNFKLALSTSEGVFLFKPDEIIRLQGDNNYTHFHFCNRKPMIVSRTLKEYDELLKEYNFIRVHKSHLINRKYICSVNREGYITMEDNSVVEISRRKKEEVRKILKS